jgi:hypothetical protein
LFIFIFQQCKPVRCTGKSENQKPKCKDFFFF